MWCVSNMGSEFRDVGFEDVAFDNHRFDLILYLDFTYYGVTRIPSAIYHIIVCVIPV